MKISINSLQGLNRRYGCTGDIAPQGVDELARKIGAQLGAIEETIDVGSKYQGVIVAKIISCEDHPNADRLHVCMIDDGGQAQHVERNEQGHVQVVCGAPNVRAGLAVAWLPPGSTVPESVGKDPFVLEARALRGVVSNGMLASPRELALGDSHEGILEIDGDVAPGTDFADAFVLRNDYVLDIENKMFTHRPDCFGMLGVDRELAGIQQLSFKSPEWYRMDAEIPVPETDILPFTFRNEVPELVPRFMALVLSGVEVKSSPTWLQVELAKVGLRPINNIVDYTNFFMLETGQPLHAYDYDKVLAQNGGDNVSMVVRRPHAGEKIALLNGKEIDLRAEDIVVATENSSLALGGVMGGGDTEVDETTKNIIIEAATFDMYTVRRTSMAHGLFTDAVTRFNKGQSPLQNQAVLAKIVDEIRQYAGGKVASELIDNNNLPAETMQRGSLHAPVTVTTDFINERLGLALSVETMTQLLTNVEFAVQTDGETLTVTAPFWRTDIEIPEDVVEEVGRLYGFDRLPLELPSRPMEPVTKNNSLLLKQRLRDVLSQAGTNEVSSYSFVHGDLLRKVGQSEAHSYSLSNALSPDLQYYRQSLLPSLLDRVRPNVKAGYGSFGLFEIGKAHVKDDLDTEGLPTEYERLAMIFVADDKSAKQYGGVAYYQAKHYLDVLVDSLRISATVALVVLEESAAARHPYLETVRSADIKLGDVTVGSIGEFRPSVRKALKLPAFCAGFELDISALQALVDSRSPYQQLSRYPKIEQDISFKVDVGVSYDKLYHLMCAELGNRTDETIAYVVTPVDIYQPEGDGAIKHVTLRLSIQSYQKTLRDDEVNTLLDQIAVVAAETMQAQRL